MPICPCCGHTWGSPQELARYRRQARERAEQDRRWQQERDQANRRHQMLALRQQKPSTTYVAIGQQFGISTARARAIVLREQKSIKDRLSRFTLTHNLSLLLDRDLT